MNTAVIQGTDVTLRCGSNVNNSFIKWCGSYVVTSCNPSNFIYNGYTEISEREKFSVTKVNNATHVTRDLIISSTELTDVPIYLCEEHIPRKEGVRDSSSAQVIVLGNYS